MITILVTFFGTILTNLLLGNFNVDAVENKQKKSYIAICVA